MKAKELFPNFRHEIFSKAFDLNANVWEWLPLILKALGDTQYISPKAKVCPTAVITGPCYIDDDVQVRSHAFLRGGVIALKGAVLGHACEYKNVFLMEKVETAHFNYVGDSILGMGAHLGAGAQCANVRQDKKSIRVMGYDTSLDKIGAFVGEGAEVGCNAVLNPGTILMPRAVVMPLASAKGLVGTGEMVR